MHVGPCSPVGIHLQKAEVGPTSAPTWRRSRLVRHAVRPDLVPALHRLCEAALLAVAVLRVALNRGTAEVVGRCVGQRRRRAGAEEGAEAGALGDVRAAVGEAAVPAGVDGGENLLGGEESALVSTQPSVRPSNYILSK
jgi:hypothetical protein